MQMQMQASTSRQAGPTETPPLSQNGKEKARKPSKPQVSAEELEERREVRNKGTQARADKEATFLRLLEEQQKEVNLVSIFPLT